MNLKKLAGSITSANSEVILLHQSLGHKAGQLANDIVDTGLFKHLGKLHSVLGQQFIPQ
jgi:hypothetical protein